MRTIKVFTDTETTGLQSAKDQILSYAIIAEAPNLLITTEFEQTLKLKQNVFPSPSALIINNINPFTPEWNQKAVHEYEAIKKLYTLAHEWEKAGDRVWLIAYNAEFDVDFFISAFARIGLDFNKFYPQVWDPLPSVKSLIAQGIIVTEEVKTSYSKSYRTSKLEEVYKALGFDISKIKSHTALDDTKMLQQVAHAVYKLITGKELSEVKANPRSYKENQFVQVIVDEAEDGIQKHHIKVLANDLENEQVLVLDLGLVRSIPESPIRWISHHKIYDELPTEDSEVQNLESFHVQSRESIQSQMLTLKIPVTVYKKLPLEKELHDLAQKMMSTTDTEDLKQMSKTLTPEELALLPLAEAYSYCRYNQGWSSQIKGADHASLVEFVDVELPGVSLGFDPLGKYLILENEILLLSTEKKTELTEFLVAKFNLAKGGGELKALNKKIKPIKDFKDSKHPEIIKEEFEHLKGEIFNAANKHHKDILQGCLKFYQAQAPKHFKEVSMPTFKLDLSSLLKKR